MSLGFVAGPEHARRTARAGALPGRACSRLAAGIVLEVYGFSLRVLISGWAPVTNMYETVIWVALVAAVLGLVFELIFRRTFTALAGSGGGPAGDDHSRRTCRCSTRASRAFSRCCGATTG